MPAKRVEIEITTNHELHSFEECVRRVALATSILERIIRRIDGEKAEEPHGNTAGEERPK